MRAMRTKRLRRRAAAIGIGVAVASLATTPITSHVTASASDFAQPFAADSPFRTLIPADAPVDPNSAAMISAVAWDTQRECFDHRIRHTDIYRRPRTPRYTVPCTIPEWGHCPFDGLQVPIPDGGATWGSDSAMVVIDPASRTISSSGSRSPATVRGRPGCPPSTASTAPAGRRQHRFGRLPVGWCGSRRRDRAGLDPPCARDAELQRMRQGLSPTGVEDRRPINEYDCLPEGARFSWTRAWIWAA